MDPEAIEAILVDNLRDALSQVTQYLGVGLVAAISAFVLDRAPTGPGGPAGGTGVPGFPKMPRPAAKLVFLGVYFVAGMMAYLACQSALEIMSKLSDKIRAAACTQASIVTSAIGYRIAAALLPILFVAPIVWREWSRFKNAVPKDSGSFVALAGFFMLPYLALGWTLLRV